MADSTRNAAQQLGIEGQWTISIALSSTTPVPINALNEFTIIEEVGNLLPTWQIDFVAGKDLEKDWVESLEIPITISQSINSPEKLNTKLQIIRPYVQQYQGGFRQYRASGVYHAPAFVNTPFLTTTKACNGTDVLQEIAKKHFDKIITDDMTTSSEVQAWSQVNTTDKKFIDYVSSRCYIHNSFVGTGITSAGHYIIVDVVKITNKKEKYTIGGDNGLTLLGMPKVQSNSGFMNSAGGYGMDTPIISQDGGIRTVHRPQIKFGLVNNTHSEIGNVQRKTLAPVKCSMSNDPKSYMAKANFDMGNALLAMETCVVTVQASYFPIKIWDVVNLLCPNLDNPSLNTNYSGKYVVTKVSRSIQNNMFYTSLYLNRDAHNESK